MKIYISKILVILLMINALVPFSAFANSEMTLYNRGEAVALSEDLQSYNDSLYISISDLQFLTISADYFSPVVYMSNDDCNATVYLESSIVILNSVKILYKSPLILINAVPYVSLDLVAMIFSSIYEVDLQTSTIELWTKAKYSKIINGFIKLPNGKTAPQGGISLDVFVGSIEPTSSGGHSSGTSYPPSRCIGFPGIDKPAIPNTTGGTEYEYINKKTITIPEGENSIEFILEVPEESLNKTVFVGYKIESEEYNETYAVPYYDFCNDVFYFEIYEMQIRSISGSVTLPQAVTEDIYYTVFAHNDDDTYVCKGMIEQGQSTTDYLLDVKGGENYTVSIAFDNGKYMRSDYSESVYVGVSYNISGINFFAVPSNIITGTIILPDGFAPTGDITATVNLQAAESPYYYLDTREITIPYGSNYATFELFDDMDVSNVIVFYELSDNVDGLYNYGLFSSIGTSSTVQYADVLTFDGTEHQMPLLKTKEITISVKLPDNEIADADIYGRLYAVPCFNKSMSVQSNSSELVSNIGYTNNGLSLYSVQSESEFLIELENAKDYYEIDNLIMQNLDLLNVGKYSNLSTNERLTVAKIVGNYTYSSIEDLIARINYAIEKINPPTSSGSGGGGSSSGGGIVVPVAIPLIEENSSNGTSTITVADEYGVNYNVLVSDILGSDKYYNKVYYKENSSTVLKDNATSIGAGTENIEVTLMRQNIVSGKVQTNTNDVNFNIYAIYQDNTSVKKDIYNSMLVCYSNDIDNSYNYYIGVPAELEDYIFAMKPNNKEFFYYSQTETKNEFNSADVVIVNSNIENINFTYEGFEPPVPLSITSIRQNVYSNYWNIVIENISDFHKENIKINACFYDANKRLQKTITENIDLISGNTYRELSMNFGSAYSQATTAKIFLWTENMQPLSNAYIFKSKLDEGQIKDADVVFQIGSTTMYIDGKAHSLDVAPTLLEGQMLVPMRAFAESLGWMVSWNAETQTAEFECGGNVLAVSLGTTIATFNGNMIELECPLQLVNDRTLAPAGEIARCFGYNVDWESFSGILRINK